MFTDEEKRFMLAVLSQLNWNISQKREFEIASSITEKLQTYFEVQPEVDGEVQRHRKRAKRTTEEVK